MSRADDYANLVTTLGTVKDKARHTVFLPGDLLDPNQLTAMHRDNPLIATVVDRLPDDATREGFQVVGEGIDQASVQSEAQDLDLIGTVGDAWRWARLYGGALVVMVVDDGLPLSEPMDLANATKLSALHVVESPYATPRVHNPGLGARAFRRPTFYDVLAEIDGSDAAQSIHWTRTIRFEGLKVPPSRLHENGGWPPSVVQRIHDDAMRLGSAMSYAGSILHDLSMLQLKIKNFRNMVTGSKEEKQEARAIVESIRWNADNQHTIALDSEDELIEMSRTISGVTELIDRFVNAVVRATHMPRTVLLGEQPGGMNTTADGEMRSWYDSVAAKRDQVLTPALTRILEVMFRIRRNNGETIPDEWTIDYPPLWQDTAQEKSDTLDKLAKALDTLVAGSIISIDEARATLETYSLVTMLEEDGG